MDHYRKNVAMVIADGKGKVLLAKRCDGAGWQFPQGGVEADEDCEQALYRELYEEVGLQPRHVLLVASTANYLRYIVPKHLRRVRSLSGFSGQRQRWFLLRMLADNDAVDLNLSATPEFDDWHWVSYWHPLHECVQFKRDIYRQGLGLLSSSHARMCRQVA
jgi:putative (di)nucleoside polyphosphate hydrolase